MPLIHQFFVTDEQHEAILQAVAAVEAEGVGRDAAFATVMYTGACYEKPLDATPATPKAPAKKTPAKRR
jgi:hypothetical protein